MILSALQALFEYQQTPDSALRHPLVQFLSHVNLKSAPNREEVSTNVTCRQDMNEPSNFLDGSSTGCADNSLNNPPFTPGVSGGSLISRTVCMDADQYAGKHYNLHNMYGFTEAIVTSTVLSEIRQKRPFAISRSSFVGLGSYVGHWSGDISSSWGDMAWTVPELLSMSLFGIPLMGADICGFNGNTNNALCQRWMELGAFYPFSRNHNGKGYTAQDPASLGEDVVAASKKALLVRYSLLPYLYTLFYEAHTDGSTVVTPIFFEFPSDESTYSIDTAFMWGSGLLIAPVLTEATTQVDIYLPSAQWYDFYTGALLTSGGADTTLDAPLDTIPLLVRGGHILPMQEPGMTTTASRKNNFQLMVASDESGSASGELYWDDGDTLGETGRGSYTGTLLVRQGGGAFSGTVSVRQRRGTYTGTLSELLSMSLFGIPLMGADICGFNGDTTVPLCQRWMELGAFYPFSRNHNGKGQTAQDPASLGDDVVAASKKALLVRYSLLPYLYTLFYKAHTQGETVVRPIFFEFPSEDSTYRIDTAFMWGPGLLIAPVLQEATTQVDIYLPSAQWYDFYTGALLTSGGADTTLDAPLDTIPLLVRGGHILPMQEPGMTTTASRKNNFQLMVASDESGSASGELYWDDGDTLGETGRGSYTGTLLVRQGGGAFSGTVSVRQRRGTYTGTLLGRIELYWDTLGETGRIELYWDTLGETGRIELYWDTLGETGRIELYWDTLGERYLYWDTLGETGRIELYWDTLGETGRIELYWDTLGETGRIELYWDTLGETEERSYTGTLLVRQGEGAILGHSCPLLPNTFKPSSLFAGTYEAGAYTLVSFSLQSSQLTGTPKKTGYTGENMNLATITVLGVSSASSVTANGGSTTFTYDGTNKVLTITGLSISLSDSFTVTWS
uniref:(California timema) hypothetical protein n=1 Tax=Timema californicum TaxID=61474 RepID=A0A7R9JEK9_TIMCA|nr:unnamed protein product [Timema californicum]